MQSLPKVGDEVLVHRLPARVCFVGETEFSDGTWVGVELFDAVGRNDGSVRGTRYFTCKPQVQSSSLDGSPREYVCAQLARSTMADVR